MNGMCVTSQPTLTGVGYGYVCPNGTRRISHCSRFSKGYHDLAVQIRLRDVRIADGPQNISDPRTDCGSFVDEKLRTRTDADPNP